MRRCIAWVFLLLALTAVGSAASGEWLANWRRKNPVWRGLHMLITSDAAMNELERQVPTLAKEGVNVIIAEPDWSFQFKSRPEMNDPNGVSFEAARRFARTCRANGIRPIPQINLLGHQSWAETTGLLLVKHPELDETPGQFPGNKGIYCRSWCPQHPDLMKVVAPLIDEMVDAFEADAFHVGMDEVFLVAHDSCPRCKGGDPAKLFAKAVNDLHTHVVKKRGLEMFMWADRFLDGKATGLGEWEAATNGTHPALGMVPKDIVLCDWHYEPRRDYPSLKILTDAGFRVWPSGYRDLRAVDNFSLAAKTKPGGGIVGYMVTTWGSVGPDKVATWPPFLKGMAWWRPAR